MAAKRYKIRPVSKVFIFSTLIALVFFASIACYSSFAYQRESIVMQCDAALRAVYDHYDDKAHALSDVYVPIFKTEENEAVMRGYFARRDFEGLNYTQRADLVALLGEMMDRDSDIEFIALVNPRAIQNFYLTANGSQLKPIWSDLPIGGNAHRMQLLGSYTWKNDDGMERRSFIIRGGSVPAGSEGGILVGYSTAAFDSVLRRSGAQNLATFVITNESGLIYDSSRERYAQEFDTDWIVPGSDVHSDPGGFMWYTGVIRSSGRVFTAAYLLPFWDLIRMANRDTPSLLLILACFGLFVISLYYISARYIFRKVERIHEGLDVIGGNHLDHRLSISIRGDEFDEIARHINTMTELLKISTEKEYEMRVRETAAELNSVQARFNPHFLYNTLEVVRGKLFASGDVETADYIEKLARIFRNLTDAAPIMSIREEIAFCSLYMALLQLRFSDSVEISYDVDSDVQDCGILAHLIQPAIENYFMHALDESTDYHTLDITCEPASDTMLRIIIADNGTGSDDAHIHNINQRLHNPVISDRGYGLMSIAKRIRVFYGEAYGVHLEKNEPCGMRVIVTIPRMSVEEHQKKLGIDT